MRSMFTTTMLTGALALTAAATLAQEQRSTGWSGQVGLGARVGPSHPGSPKTTTTPLPLVEARSPDGRWFVSTRSGVGVNVLNAQTTKAGVAVTYVPGRDSEDDVRLGGIKDIDPAAGVRLFASHAITEAVTVRGDLTKDLGGGDGMRATVGIDRRFEVTPALRIIAGADTTWDDENDQETWFGVTPAQSAASSLPRFQAGAGIRDIRASLGGTYALTPKIGLSLVGSVSRLLGDAADSPVSADDTGPALMGGISYRF